MRRRPWSLDTVARLVGEVGSAMTAAHASGVAHRDLKPSNLLFDESGNSYVAGFGLARRPRPPRNDDRHHHRHRRLRCRHPPVARRRSPVRHQPDGREEARPLSSLAGCRPEVLTNLDSVLRAATAPDPGDGYANMDEFVSAFHTTVGLQTPLAASVEMDVALQNLAGRARAPRVAPANPYKGLRPFEEADAPDFFGRDQLVNEIVRRMAKSRFVAVVGPSGSGKSSAVHAGVIPHLRRAGAYVATMTPGARPMEELETALLRISTEPAPTLLDQLNFDEHGLGECVRRILPDDHRDLVLVIDQFEELFTITAAERRTAFLAAIAAAATDDRGRLRVVVTLRADFVDRPLLDPTISELVRDNTLLIGALNTGELRRAMTRRLLNGSASLSTPISSMSWSATAFGQPGSLPLLQYHAHRDLRASRRHSSHARRLPTDGRHQQGIGPAGRPALRRPHDRRSPARRAAAVYAADHSRRGHRGHPPTRSPPGACRGSCPHHRRLWPRSPALVRPRPDDQGADGRGRP